MDKDRERIRWACRRGMLELDLFLVPFFEHSYDALSEQEQATFVSLLSETDPTLLSYFMANATSPNLEQQSLVDKIREYKLKPYTDRCL